MRRTFCGVLLGRDAAPQQAPGPEAHVAVEAGPAHRASTESASGLVLQRGALSPAPVGAGGRAQGHHAPGDVDHLAGPRGRR